MTDQLHTNLRAAENVLRGGSMYGHLASEVKRARETLELILALAGERDQPFIADLARDALHPRDYLDRPYAGEVRLSNGDEQQQAAQVAAIFRTFTKSSHRFYDGRPLHVVAGDLLERFAADGLLAEDRAILEAVHRELDREGRNGDAPGHAHEIPGVWDSDNGAMAGKPCAWCLTWRKFTALIRADAPDSDGEAVGNPEC